MRRVAKDLFLGSLCGAVLFGMFSGGCTSTHVDSPFQRQLDSLGVTVNSLRHKNTDRILQTGLIIEAASDSIISLSREPRIRQAARTWRLYALPGLRQALSFHDPATATLDGWAFAIQHLQYLDSDAGRMMFGDQQQIAVRAASRIEMLFSVNRPFEEGSESIRQSIERWVKNHPIEDGYFARPSMIPELQALKIVQDESLMGSVGGIAADVREISNRMSVYSTQLPREARWQVEEVLGGLRLHSRLDTLTLQVRGIVETVDALAGTINSGNLTVDVRSLQQLHMDILSLQEKISSERAMVLSDIDRQRMETLRQVDSMVKSMMRHASDPAKELIDHLMFRFLQVLGVAAAGILLVFGFQFLRRKQEAR